MENTTVKYTIIRNKYLADALSFIGFRYYIFNNKIKAYSFEDTEKFRFTLAKVLELKKQVNNI